MTRIAALIPAYNEESRLAETLEAVLQMEDVEEVLVIDDGSDDRTPFVAYDAGAKVVQHEDNLGKGAALNTGVREVKADVYLIIDADLGWTAGETHFLLDPVLSGEADMSIAIMKAPEGHKGGFGFVQRLARWGIKKYGRMEAKAPLSGQRAIRREVIDAVGGFEERFGVETALTIDALRRGFRVVEMPLTLSHRVTGRDWRGIIHRARQFRDVWKVIRKRAEEDSARREAAKRS